MKKTYILLALICVTLLSSCDNTEVVETEEIPTLETKQSETMAELTGNVVIDMNHALA
jgi:protein involved in sex pheromone biosynthesis